VYGGFGLVLNFRYIIMVAISGGGRVVGVQSVLKILNLDFW
jgi:hypothetical protein